VLRLDAGEAILYANAAAEVMRGLYTEASDRTVTGPLVQAAGETFRIGKTQEVNFASGKRLFALALIPVPAERHINLYARDVPEERREQERARTREVPIRESQFGSAGRFRGPRALFSEFLSPQNIRWNLTVTLGRRGG